MLSTVKFVMEPVGAVIVPFAVMLDATSEPVPEVPVEMAPTHQLDREA